VYASFFFGYEGFGQTSVAQDIGRLVHKQAEKKDLPRAPRAKTHRDFAGRLSDGFSIVVGMWVSGLIGEKQQCAGLTWLIVVNFNPWRIPRPSIPQRAFAGGGRALGGHLLDALIHAYYYG